MTRRPSRRRGSSASRTGSSSSTSAGSRTTSGRATSRRPTSASPHFEALETRYAFRTRLLDHFWAGLPTIATAGDTLGDLIGERRLGRTVDRRTSAPGARDRGAARRPGCVRRGEVEHRAGAPRVRVAAGDSAPRGAGRGAGRAGRPARSMARLTVTLRLSSGGGPCDLHRRDSELERRGLPRTCPARCARRPTVTFRPSSSTTARRTAPSTSPPSGSPRFTSLLRDEPRLRSGDERGNRRRGGRVCRLPQQRHAGRRALARGAVRCLERRPQAAGASSKTLALEEPGMLDGRRHDDLGVSPQPARPRRAGHRSARRRGRGLQPVWHRGPGGGPCSRSSAGSTSGSSPTTRTSISGSALGSLGYECWYAPLSVVLHHRDGTGGSSVDFTSSTR